MYGNFDRVLDAFRAGFVRYMYAIASAPCPARLDAGVPAPATTTATTTAARGGVVTAAAA